MGESGQRIRSVGQALFSAASKQHKLKVSNTRCNIKHSLNEKSVHCRSWFTMGKPGLKGSEGYEEKREKNNEAVRKSREKKRELERVREENRRMEEQIQQLESNIEILKGGVTM